MSELLRETERGRSFVIRRRGKPVARLLPPLREEQIADGARLVTAFRAVRARIPGMLRSRARRPAEFSPPGDRRRGEPRSPPAEPPRAAAGPGTRIRPGPRGRGPREARPPVAARPPREADAGEEPGPPVPGSRGSAGPRSIRPRVGPGPGVRGSRRCW
ncbi:MAG: hypothetical protein HY359_03140 [Candidatus Rokubacteria bacterium]|nr:hypothetical protein [Candidatus Rokubacteria bacterium]